jgi:putative membrane-bound dehydrogenase-like protein
MSAAAIRVGAWLTLVSATTAVAWSATSARDRAVPLPPAEALAAFQIEAGLRVELVAAEPLVVSPVAFAFDERGRIYVAEARGYPESVDPKAPATNEGRIAMLEDTDGDGTYDRRTEFARGLTYPSGIAVWRGGVFVTCAPDILYFKDTDGDGVADEKRVALTGFDTSRSSQLRVSSPVLGLDGRFYVASGLTGGKVTSPEHPERPVVTFTPADGRFDPDNLVYEVTGGRGQFGLTFDGFGRRFVSSNRHPILQVVLEPWHLRRNPQLGFTASTQEVSKVEAEARVWPISRAAVTADFIPNLINAPHSGTFTSACSVLMFGGRALPATYQGNAFVCEPAQNLVQRQVLVEDGASYRATPATAGREFLASSDTWFRPVFLANGPDGALYVADMHRREIDHPVYVPEEARGGFDFVSGKASGRIYRIVAERGPRVAKFPDTVPGLLRELESVEVWRRDTAHRVLLERKNEVGASGLEQVAAKATQPEARVRALVLLRAKGALSEGGLLPGLADPVPAVREAALGLAEDRLAAEPAVLDAVLKLAGDADARVRFACALVLATSPDARVPDALAEIVVRAGEDRWARAAALSGVSGRLETFYTGVQRRAAAYPVGALAVQQEVGRLFGAGGSAEACRRFLADTLEGGGDFNRRALAVLGVVEGWRTRSGAGAAPWLALGDGLRTLAERAAVIARDGAAGAAERVAAVTLVGAVGEATSGEVLRELLDARQPVELQLAVVRVLERRGDAASGALLTDAKNWPRYSPQVRAAALAALTAKLPLLGGLFDAIERGTLAPTDVAPAKRTQLLKHANAAIRARAETAFKRIEAGDRMQVYRAQRDVLTQVGAVAKGREAFLRVCAACHTRGGVGGKVGPDLTGIRNQPADAILLHTLVPNFEVAPAYQAMTVETRDGRSLAGWIAAETENALTLRTAAGGEELVLRSNLVSLTAAGVSLMPDGLEQAMTPDELAGLIAFLKSEL